MDSGRLNQSRLRGEERDGGGGREGGLDSTASPNPTFKGIQEHSCTSNTPDSNAKRVAGWKVESAPARLLPKLGVKSSGNTLSKYMCTFLVNDWWENGKSTLYGQPTRQRNDKL